MSEQKSGGPAFPQEIVNNGDAPVALFGHEIPAGERAHFGGMTLRDYFAAKAMQKMVPDLQAAGELAMAGTNPAETIATISQASYRVADAMLAASAEPGQQHAAQRDELQASYREAASAAQRLQLERDELLAALAFYADERDYEGRLCNDGDGRFDQMGFDILEDKGATARAAIAKAKGGAA